MKFSSQEEYGLRCLLHVARKSDRSPTIAEISHAEGLSQPNVAKLLMILRRAEFVTSTRGQLGGYSLARDARDIRVGDVLAALGGRLYDDDFCRRHADNRQLCNRAVDCSIRSLWQRVQSAVDSSLESITLADLLVDDSRSNVTMFDQPTPRAEIAVEA